MKFRQLIQAVLVALLLVALYDGAIRVGLVSESSGIAQWEGNVIRAEHYIYQDDTEAQLVLVGSSLIRNIGAEDIAPQAFNLGMAGGSVQTGLEIVRRSGRKAGVLLVELNETIMRQTNHSLIDTLFHPLLNPLRRLLPELRTSYRPFSVLVNSLRSDGPIRMVPVNPALRTRSVERLLHEEQTLLTEAELELFYGEVELIKAQIAALESAGWQVMLFDVPRDIQVEQTPRRQQVRTLLRERFPASHYTWLPDPPDHPWATNDGTHILRNDVRIFAAYLRTQLGLTSPLPAVKL